MKEVTKLIREDEIFDLYYTKLAAKTDRMFAVLFVFQWLLGIVFALWVSPKTWAGNNSQIHMHVYAAIFLGGLVSAFPIYLTLVRPGHSFNKYVVATAQIFYSILFIHLTGGRIETHFHIFGSLAFLAFYRDFKPVLLATIISSADHLLRGIYWPESVYGVLYASPLRALEHSSWIIFEVVILYVSIKNGIDQLKTIAKHQATIETTLSNVEHLVEQRTLELKESQKRILEQQQQLIYSSKMSALGEMAGGVAHEINTPLAIISMRVEQLQESLELGSFEPENFNNGLKLIKKTTDRIANIVKGLRFFARDGRQTVSQKIDVFAVIDDTLSLCKEKFKNYDITLKLNREKDAPALEILCRPIEISQVLLNLLNNAYDAIESLEDKWISLDVIDLGHAVEIALTDSGHGIPQEVQDKIMQPFFTTKEIGRGTGLGLSISKGIIEEHDGQFYIDSKSNHTRFVMVLPKGLGTV